MFVSNFSERVHLLSLQSTRRVPFNRGYIQRVQWKSVSVKELQIGIFILILRMVLVTSLTVIMLKKCSYRWCNNKIERCVGHKVQIVSIQTSCCRVHSINIPTIFVKILPVTAGVLVGLQMSIYI